RLSKDEYIQDKIGTQEIRIDTLEDAQIDLATNNLLTADVNRTLINGKLEAQHAITELDESRPEPTTAHEWLGGTFGAVGVLGAIVTGLRYRTHRRKQKTRQAEQDKAAELASDFTES